MPVEVLSTGVWEYDPNGRLEVTDTDIVITDLDDNEVAAVVRDFGKAYFNADFRHRFYFQCSGMASTSRFQCYGLSNYTGPYKDTEDSLFLYVYRGSPTLYLRETYSSGTDATDSMNVSQATVYYVQVERDEDVGTYGTLYASVYSDAAYTVLVDTLTVALHVKNDFSLLHYARQIDNTGAGGHTADGAVGGFSLDGGATIESFSYVRTDPKWPQPWQRVAHTLLNNNTTAYVAYDKGAAYFDGDFTHLLSGVCSSAGANDRNIIWALANVLTDWYDVFNTLSESELSLQFVTNALWRIYETDSGTNYYDSFVSVAGTPYWVEIVRDEAVGTYGTFYCYVYSDSERVTLVDTLTITLHSSKKDYRYFYALQSYNNAVSSRSTTGWCQDYSLDDGLTYENIAAYTKVDPNSNIQRRVFSGGYLFSGDRVEANDTTNAEVDIAYWDYGADYFSGSQEHHFAAQAIGREGLAHMCVWAISNTLGEWNDNSQDFISVHYKSSNLVYLTDSIVGGATTRDYCNTLAEGVVSYIEVVVDRTVGTYGTAYCYIYNDVNKTDLEDTLVVACQAVKSYRYLYAMQTEDISAADRRWTGWSGSLSKDGGATVENYSTISTSDPNNRLKVHSRYRKDWTSLIRDKLVCDYTDAGADHFNSDFEHLLETRATEKAGNSLVFPWMLANDVADYLAIDTAGGSLIALGVYMGGTERLILYELDSGSPYSDYYTALLGVTYYLEIERDEDVGTYGTLYCRIYSDAARTVLLDSLVQTLHSSKKDYRFLYTCNSYVDGSTVIVQSGWSQNYDLQEATGAAPKWMYYQRTRRAS